MKALLGLFVTLLSLAVFAGPEEHKQQQICYSLAERHVNQPSLPSANLPWHVCLESVAFDAKTNQITVVSYFQPELFKGLKVLRTVPQGPGQTVFLASNPYFQKQAPGCGRAEEFRLNIAGISNGAGVADPTALKIYIEHTVTADSCFKPASKFVYTFEAK
jgi:hypothetical protein